MKTKISILFFLNFILLTACKKEETRPEDDTSTYFIKAKFNGPELIFDDSGVILTTAMGKGSIDIIQDGTQYQGNFILEAVNVGDNNDILHITNGGFKLTSNIH